MLLWQSLHHPLRLMSEPPIPLSPITDSSAASSKGGSPANRSETGAALSDLAAADLLIAQIYGSVFPHDPSPRRVASWLSKIGLKGQARRLTEADVSIAIRVLTRLDVLTDSSDGSGPTVTAALAPQLTQQAWKAGFLFDLLRQVDHDFYPYNYGNPPRLVQMKIRAFAIAGQYAQLARLSPFPPGVWLFLSQPTMAGTLRSLPQGLLRAALLDCLEHQAGRAESIEHSLELAQVYTGDSVEIFHAIAFARVLQGRFDAIDAEFARLDKPLRVGRSGQTALASLHAMVALLQGEDQQAHAHIEAALDAERGTSRRRNLFPNWSSFAFALLALVRLDTPATHALLERCLKIADRDGLFEDYVRCVQAALTLQKDPQSDLYWPRSDRSDLATLLYGLVRCWRANATGKTTEQISSDTDHQALEDLFTNANRNGFTWLANQTAQVLLAMRPTSAAQQGFSARVDQQLHATDLTTLVSPQAEWEYPLKALEQLAHSNQPKPGAAARKTPEQPRRLCWRIDIDSQGQITLTPREQRQQKNGAWSKGRNVTLNRLLDEPEQNDFLSEQDQLAAALIMNFSREQGYSDEQQQLLNTQALWELAGHPYLEDAKQRSISVARNEPELIIEPVPTHDAADQLVAHVIPTNPARLEYTFAKVTDDQFCVTRFSPAHSQLLDIIPSDGLQLPVDAKDRLLEAVVALAGEIRISSLLDGESLPATVEVEPSSATLVQLVPTGDGLTVTLLTEPVAESGAYCSPARGSKYLVVNRAGENVATHRDLVAERAALDQLRLRCPSIDNNLDSALLLIGSPASKQFEQQLSFRVTDQNDCLELLDQLHLAQAQCLWPQGQSLRITARSAAPALTLRIDRGNDWFEASGELQVNDSSVLQLQQLLALLETNPKSRFLKLEDGAFLALTDSFKRQLDDLSALASSGKDGKVKLHELSALALGELADASELSADEAWDDLRERFRSAQDSAVAVPATLKADLRPYQIEGYQWLARLADWGTGACLADDMGLGKTVQTLALLLHRASAGPALVVAPTSVTSNWLSEAARFAPSLNIVSYGGAAESRLERLQALGPDDVVVCTYGLLQRDLAGLAEVHWHTLVIDEAQAIKNAGTARTRAVKSLTSDFRLATTGTPIENNLMDLHSLFSFLNPGYLGTAAQFHGRFVVPIERDQDSECRERLRQLIAPFILRRHKTQVLADLPERTEVTLHVELSQPEATLYEALRRRAVDTLSQTEKRNKQGEQHLQVLAELTKLRLACCHPKLVQEAWSTSSAKLDMFSQTVQELLENQHKVLVFSQFVKHLKILAAQLDDMGVSYQYLDGQTPQKKRAERIDAFQAGEGDLFLISLKAGGTGLNLTAADYVIHMDPWWNPAVEDQASDRAHRIGQTRPVTIYRMVTQGTIEEQIVELHTHKRDLADQLLAGSDGATRLSVDDLMQLLQNPS